MNGFKDQESYEAAKAKRENARFYRNPAALHPAQMLSLGARKRRAQITHPGKRMRP